MINGIIIKESEIILYFYESKLDLRDLKKQNSLSKSLELYNLMSTAVVQHFGTKMLHLNLKFQFQSQQG